MTTFTLITKAATATNTIGSHSHPVLEEGNLSYPDGCYAVEIKLNDDRSSFEISHKITNAPLISELAEDGCVTYACIVSSPKSFYRVTHTSDSPQHTVAWEGQELGEPPLFTPVLLCRKPVSLDLSAKEHGVHSVWDDTTVTLERGARLALGNVFDLRTSSVTRLITLQRDDELTDGVFFVSSASEPLFTFCVRTAPDLHAFLQRDQSTPAARNILTHIVSACLCFLQRNYGEQRNYSDPEEIESAMQQDRNLEGLVKFLEEQTGRRWPDDDFSPERVATQLYPHVVPNEGDDS